VVFIFSLQREFSFNGGFGEEASNKPVASKTLVPASASWEL